MILGLLRCHFVRFFFSLFFFFSNCWHNTTTEFRVREKMYTRTRIDLLWTLPLLPPPTVCNESFFFLSLTSLCQSVECARMFLWMTRNNNNDCHPLILIVSSFFFLFYLFTVIFNSLRIQSREDNFMMCNGFISWK